MRCDAVIFGGGIAGLWLLDELRRNGCSAVLIEAGDLGSGQTVASQGIIHGGLKYTLQGLLTRSAANISEMPGIWRACLAGQRAPDLSRAVVRANCCHLWRTESLRSRMGMIGARVGLRVAPQNLAADERPSVLAACPGTVARLDEQVIAPASLVAALRDLNSEAVIKCGAAEVEFECSAAGHIRRLHLTRPGTGATLTLEPRRVVLTAGAGNGALRERCGLDSPVMQLRPLHMLMVRGKLPELNGHCVDGAKTRVTITSDRTSGGETVWQVGGQLAELGVELPRHELVARGRRELEAVLPGVGLSEAEWGSYRAVRAERIAPGGKRPDGHQIVRDGNTLTAWPTKLVLAPVLAREIAAEIVPQHPDVAAALSGWTRPDVALPPWEFAQNWSRDEAVDDLRRAA